MNSLYSNALPLHQPGVILPVVVLAFIGKQVFTPALLQLVVKVPWRYGQNPLEKENSFVYCRINLFASQAAFNGCGRLIRVGDPVTGFVEPTSGDANSAQAIAWDIVDPALWKLSAPATVPAIFELNPNVLFRIPQLAADNFLYVRFPKTNFAFIAAPTPVFSGFSPQKAVQDQNAVLRGRSLDRSNARNLSSAPPRVRQTSADFEKKKSSNWSVHTPAALLVERISGLVTSLSLSYS